MEASQGKDIPSLADAQSTRSKSVEEFENKLREENILLLRNLRIKEMIGKAKSNDPALWPFK